MSNRTGFANWMSNAALSTCLMLPVFAHSAAAQVEYETEQATFRLETIASGLAFPWSIAFPAEDILLITERDGSLRAIVQGRLQDEPVADLSALNIFVQGQSGLHDVVLHPNFSENRWIYLAYASGNGNKNHIGLARGTWNGATLDDIEVLYRTPKEKRGGAHPGGRIVFIDDGTLLLTVGDGYGYKDDAQSTDSPLGSVLRLTENGAPAPIDESAQMGLREIYTKGHRNIQGMSVHPETGDVWTHEHGARGGDEINILAPGKNYGWPLATYGIDYSGELISDKRVVEGTQQPIWYWVPSIAPSGLTIYSGTQFPEWEGDLFIGALAHQKLVRMELDGTRIISQEDLLDELGERIRDVRTGPDGALYVLTDSDDGKVLRLVAAD